MNLEEELLLDAQEDAQAVEFIKNYLPQELKERFNDEALYYFLDVIVEYFAESGILDAPADKDGYIEIDEEAVAAHLAKQAKKEGIGTYTPEELLFVVQGYSEFEESMEE